jgi:hypothetical protein
MITHAGHRKTGLLVRHTCGIDKMYEGSSYSGDDVRGRILPEEKELNRRLMKHRLSDAYINVQFNPAFTARDMRADGSADRYSVQFLVIRGKEVLGVGSTDRSKALDQRIADGKADASALESIAFNGSLPGEHPFTIGNLYSKEDLDRVADFLNLASSLVRGSSVTGPKPKLTLGAGVFDDDKIIVVEGVNSPFRWMGEPFGPDRIALDRYDPDGK